MTIPSEWSTLPLERDNQKGAISQKYQLKSDDEVKFLLYCREREVAEDVASDLRAVLVQPPHKLAQKEYETIEYILRHMSEDDFFARSNVETKSFGGCTVLVVEGLWKASSVKNYALFVPGNDRGTIIDEIHFYAPAEKFDLHLPAALEIFQSIKFVNGVRRAP